MKRGMKNMRQRLHATLPASSDVLQTVLCWPSILLHDFQDALMSPGAQLGAHECPSAYQRIARRTSLVDRVGLITSPPLLSCLLLLFLENNDRGDAPRDVGGLACTN